MYGVTTQGDGTAGDVSDEDEGDIELEIQKELSNIRKPVKDPLFTSVRLDTQCCKSNGPYLSKCVPNR